MPFLCDGTSQASPSDGPGPHSQSHYRNTSDSEASVFPVQPEGLRRVPGCIGTDGVRRAAHDVGRVFGYYGIYKSDLLGHGSRYRWYAGQPTSLGPTVAGAAGPGCPPSPGVRRQEGGFQVRCPERVQPASCDRAGCDLGVGPYRVSNIYGLPLCQAGGAWQLREEKNGMKRVIPKPPASAGGFVLRLGPRHFHAPSVPQFSPRNR